MFGWLREWIFILAVYAIASTLMISLLPKGGLAEVVKMVISMVLLLAILSPILGLLGNSHGTQVMSGSSATLGSAAPTKFDAVLARQTAEQAERLMRDEISQWLMTEKGIVATDVQVYFFIEENSIKLSGLCIHLDRDNTVSVTGLSESIRARYGTTPQIRFNEV